MKFISRLVIIILLFSLSGCSGSTKEKETAPLQNDTQASILPRESVDEAILHNKRVMIALVFGQSNSANYGAVKYTSKGAVYNRFDGKLYKAADPLLGADGTGGSVWTRLGDKIINSGKYDAVVFIPIGVGSTTVSDWAPGGKCYPLLTKAIKENHDITHIFWHQGESDNLAGTSEEDYTNKMNQIIDTIRREGIEAPIYISVASYILGKIDINVQNAQKKIVDYSKNILPGPNTDLLEDRIGDDNAHFTELGLDKFSDMWLNLIVKS